MSYGNYYDRSVFDSVDRVGEPIEQTSSNLWFYLLGRKRICFYELYCSIQSVKEIQTRVRLSFVEPENSVIDFLLSECEEPDVHLLLVLTH